MKLFLPLTKVDVEKREVWGRATQEVADKANEILDYASSKPLFQAWSAEFEKATEGKSLGNVRAMHGSVAAGKLIAIDFNDEEKAIDIGTKIIDDAEWAKVTEGVYTGFSVGGSYAKRWQDETTPTLKRFTAQPAEMSLVDNPCVPTAHFSMVKADGSVEERKFRDPVEQVWRCGAPECFHKGKAEALAHRAEALAKDDTPVASFDYVPDIPPVVAKPDDAPAADPPKPPDAAEIAAEAAATDPPPAEKAAPTLKLVKGMWSVGDFAAALQMLGNVAADATWEAQYEGDASDLPAKIRAWLAEGAPLLAAMATEETNEMLAALAAINQAGGGADLVAASARIAGLAKKGARHSAVDQKMLQAIHDTTQDLGAHCAGPGANEDGKDAAATAGELTKLAGEKAELAKSIETLTTEKAALEKRVAEFEARPAAPKASIRAVEKAHDGVETLPDAELDAQIAKAVDPQQKALLEIKKIRRAGGAPYASLAR